MDLIFNLPYDDRWDAAYKNWCRSYMAGFWNRARLMTATQSKSIMAFDFGTQKMGMAIGQSAIESANPLPLLWWKMVFPTGTNF